MKGIQPKKRRSSGQEGRWRTRRVVSQQPREEGVSKRRKRQTVPNAAKKLSKIRTRKNYLTWQQRSHWRHWQSNNHGLVEMTT